nr:type II toxin-antitoxin system PemK/MazF family toxin [Phytoactinopolyspora halophila]
MYWTDLETPTGSRPAKRRPVLVVQSDPFNDSELATAIVVVLTSATSLAAMPGNVFLPASSTGLPKDSVVNVTALITINKEDLAEYVDCVPVYLMSDVDEGLRRVLAL